MKVLLIIYLISIIYYFIGLILLTAIIVYKARKEGLKVKKMGIAEKFRAWLRLILFAVIPIFNIIIGSIFLFSNDIENSTMDKLREESI